MRPATTSSMAMAVLVISTAVGFAQEATSASPTPAPSPSATPALPPQIAFPGQYAATPAELRYPPAMTGCRRFTGEERIACLESLASDYGRLARYAQANAALAPRKRGREARRLLRRLDHRQLVEGRLRRVLPGQAVREPRHREPHHVADAGPLPSRRAGPRSGRRGVPRRHQRHRGEHGAHLRRGDPAQPDDDGGAGQGARRARRARRRCCRCRTTRRTPTASRSCERRHGRRRASAG